MEQKKIKERILLFIYCKNMPKTDDFYLKCDIIFYTISYYILCVLVRKITDNQELSVKQLCLITLLLCIFQIVLRRQLYMCNVLIQLKKYIGIIQNYFLKSPISLIFLILIILILIFNVIKNILIVMAIKINHLLCRCVPKQL